MIRLYICFSLMFLGITLKAQDTLELKEAIQVGLDNNYTIQIEAKNLAIDENNVSRGNAGFLPSLNLSATQTNNSTNTNLEFISGETIDRQGAEEQNFNTRAELRWTLFDGFKMFTSYDRLKEIRKRGKQAFQQTVISTLSDIITQYFTLVQQKQKVATQKEALVLSNRQKDLAKTRMEVGSGSKLGFMQAKVDYNTDTSAYITQLESLQKAKIRMNELLGRKIEKDFTIKPTIPLEAQMAYTEVKQMALDNNPALNISRQDKRIAHLNRQNIQSEQYPEIGLNLGYEFNQSSSEAGFVSESQSHGPDYGLYLNYNIFDGFNTQRRKQNAQLAIDRSNLAFKQKRQEILANLRVAFTNYTNNRELVNLEQENVKVAQENYLIARENYENGGLSYIDLQEAQQNYLDAQNRLTEAKFQAKQAEVKLMKLSGKLLQNKNIEQE